MSNGYESLTIDKAVNKVNRTIFLPDIQRSFVWEEDKIYKLFDSVMRGYPINTFLFWSLSKEKIDDFNKKEQSELKLFRFVQSNKSKSIIEPSRERDDYDLVLDGQQRLTSFFIALKGSWLEGKKDKTITHELYFDVISGEKEDEDGIIYVFRFLEKTPDLYKIDSDTNGTSVWINLKKFYEDNYGKFEKREELAELLTETLSKINPINKIDIKKKINKNLNDLDDRIRKDPVINFFPEEEVNYEKVLDIFVRTNSGGTKLTYSDLLFSKIKSKWVDARNEFDNLVESLNTKNFEFDIDFILKTCLVIFSTKSEEVRYNTKNLNANIINKIKDTDTWSKISESIKYSVELLQDFLITDNKLLPSNNALIPIAYWIYKKDLKTFRTDNEKDVNEKKIMRTWLLQSLLSGIFSHQSDTILYKCKETIDSNLSSLFPALEMKKNMEALKGKSMDIDNKIDLISYKSKDSYLFLSICYKGAINFMPKMKGNRPEQDHIFSKHELENAGIDESKINSIYNIRFVTARDNKIKSKTPFKEWADGLGDIRQSVFTTHFIPGDIEYNVNNFDAFLEARKSLLTQNLKW